jgi:hypothetical protein
MTDGGRPTRGGLGTIRNASMAAQTIFALVDAGPNRRAPLSGDRAALPDSQATQCAGPREPLTGQRHASALVQRVAADFRRIKGYLQIPQFMAALDATQIDAKGCAG